MGARRYSTLLFLLTIFVVTTAVDIAESSPETKLLVAKAERNAGEERPVSEKDLLATLQELHHSLVEQIAVLEARLKSSPPQSDVSETSHLVQHYTAQKNNIEHEISLIQSIETTPASAAVPRHILTHITPEEKIVPSLINIFKKTKPTTDAPSTAYPYSLPYPPQYYPGYPAYPAYGGQFPYPYQSLPPFKPDSMDSLIQSTFPGYDTQTSNNQQTFATRNQISPAAEVNSSNFQAQTQFTPPPPPPQGTLQGEIPPTPVEPQRVTSTYPTQPQVESLHRPQSGEVQSPSNTVPQQTGQGVFIFYPNAIITEDEEQERPSIVDRVGQAFDRFGQVITNLATLQNLRSATNGNDGAVAHKTDQPPTKIRVLHNRPRSSSTQKISTPRMLDDRKPRYRWVSV